MISPNIKRAKSTQSEKVQSLNFSNTTLSINEHHNTRYVQHKLNIISKLLIPCKPSASTSRKIRASAVQVWGYLTHLYTLLSHFLLQYNTIAQENNSRDISMPLVDIPRVDGQVEMNTETHDADNVCIIMPLLQTSRAATLQQQFGSSETSRGQSEGPSENPSFLTAPPRGGGGPSLQGVTHLRHW